MDNARSPVDFSSEARLRASSINNYLKYYKDMYANR